MKLKRGALFNAVKSKFGISRPKAGKYNPHRQIGRTGGSVRRTPQVSGRGRGKER